MSIKDLTITDQNVQSTYVQSQPDRLTGTAQQNKAVFDAFPQLIRQRFNALLEALAGAGAAGEIPVGPIEGVTAENVQQALETIQQNLTAYINKIKAATGAAEVGISAISGLEADNVQVALQALRTIQSAINQNVQTIMSEKGAAAVGVSTISGMQAQNVQKALEELRKAIDDSVSGIIPGGSITADMIVDGAIVQLGALLAVAAAAAYNPSGTYAIGNYCTHEGKLHKCNTPIPSGEAWNAGHWTETSVAEELIKVMASLANKAEWNGGFLQEVSILEWAENRGINAVNTHVSTNDTVTDMPYTSFWAVGFKTYPNGGWIELKATNILTGVAWRNIKNGKQPWSGWIKIATGTPPQVRNLVLQSGFTVNGDCTFFITQENAVFLAGGVSGTLPANQDTQIGSLPADAKPVEQRRRPAVTNAGTAYIDIHTDGTVWAHPFAAASQCWFDTSFVAGGS